MGLPSAQGVVLVVDGVAHLTEHLLGAGVQGFAFVDLTDSTALTHTAHAECVPEGVLHEVIAPRDSTKSNSAEDCTESA